MDQKGLSTALAVIILAAILVVGGFLISSRQAGEPQETSEEMVSEEEEFNLPPATSPPIELVEDNGTGAVSAGEVIIIEENSIITKIFNDENSQVAILEAVDDSASSGSAYRLASDGKLYHAVIATMEAPQEGNVYEGWLVQPSPLKFISTGVMRNPEIGVWVIEYTADNEYPSYTKVVITEETIVDATPERHIIEGSF